MFSSNPFQQLTSSIHVCPPSPNPLFGHEKDDLYFNNHHQNHHHHPFVSGGCFFSPVTENVARIDQDFFREQQQDQQLVKGPGLRYLDDHHTHHMLDSVISPSKKETMAVKKDRHSKIFTAHGPRDRRVRLSMDIARKLFSLQDLLGFDKASKTLDWLFTKSKASIKELVQEMKHSSSSNVADQCEMVFMEIIKEGDQNEGENIGPMLKCVKGKKKKITQKNKAGFRVNLARDQLRTEARARARERTREKLRIKKLNDQLKKVPDNNCHVGPPPSLILQSSCWSQIPTQSIFNNKDLVGRSILDQKFLKSSPMLYSYGYQPLVSKDPSSQLVRLNFQ